MDDLIQRLRAILAEVEHRLASPTLREAAARLPVDGVDAGVALPARPDPPISSKTYNSSVADDRSATRARDIKLDDYVPSGRNPLHDDGFDPDDFIGCGDRDPLGHEDMARGRR